MRAPAAQAMLLPSVPGDPQTNQSGFTWTIGGCARHPRLALADREHGRWPAVALAAQPKPRSMVPALRLVILMTMGTWISPSPISTAQRQSSGIRASCNSGVKRWNPSPRAPWQSLMRNSWAWLLLAWAMAHTFEHSYMFARYLLVLDELCQVVVTSITAQERPGNVGAR